MLFSRRWFTANRTREAQHVHTQRLPLFTSVILIHPRLFWMSACVWLAACSHLSPSSHLHGWLEGKGLRGLTDLRNVLPIQRCSIELIQISWVRYIWQCMGLQNDFTCSGELINSIYSRWLQVYRWDLCRSNATFVRSVCAEVCVLPVQTPWHNSSDMASTSGTLPLINCWGHSHYSWVYLLSSMNSQFKQTHSPSQRSQGVKESADSNYIYLS